MGYIKKLKNNELVGGTDKHTIYPVTSTKAVFEEVTEDDKSSFKSQETINGEHDDRIKGLENEMSDTVKSITINGGTEHTVDESGNVDLTIYTVNPDDPDVPAMADLVEKNRDDIADIKEEIGTDTTQNTLSGRIKSLETTVGTGGSVDQRISDAVTTEKNRAQDIEGDLQIQVNSKQRTLSVGAGITLTSDGVISATADPSVAKVVETLPTGDNIVDGLIYLVKTGIAGTYSQHVHSTSGWSDNLPDVSLGITTDNAIDSTSTNPIQNDAITAQIGYFVCGDSNGSSATKNVDAPSYSPSDVGGAFKIKMNYANTSTDTVYLRFNSDNTTKKELRYNGEPVTPTNTWGSPEVISVYYDGQYYQASNAFGIDINNEYVISKTLINHEKRLNKTLSEEEEFTLSKALYSLYDLISSSEDSSNNNVSIVSGNVTYNNSDIIEVISSSYGAGHHELKGKSWVAKISLFSDYAFRNTGIDGADNITHIREIRNRRPSIWAKYALMVCHENTTASMNVRVKAYDNLCKTLIGMGVTPIVGTQFPLVASNNRELSNALKHYADSNKLMFADLCYYNRNFYSIFGSTTFDLGNHLGTRNSSVESDFYGRMLEKLERPEKSLKVFRLRNSYSSLINDLDNVVFHTNEERAERFKELVFVVNALENPAEVDYRPNGPMVVTNEYTSLYSTGVTFTNAALVTAILPCTNQNLTKVSLSANFTGNVHVYAMNVLAPPFPASATYVRFTIMDVSIETPSFGDVYTDGTNNYTVAKIEIGENGSNYTMYCSGVYNEEDSQIGTLTKVGGSGPSSIPYELRERTTSSSDDAVLNDTCGHWVELENVKGEYPIKNIASSVEYDKVSFLITGTSFTMKSPMVNYEGKLGKILINDYSEIEYNEDNSNTELIDESVFGSIGTTLTYWKNSGNDITTVRTYENKYPDGCGSVVNITNEQVMTQSISSKVTSNAPMSLEVWCRYFPDVYSDGSGNQITLDSYDYAYLNVKLGNVTMKSRVSTAWGKIQFEFRNLLNYEVADRKITLSSKDSNIIQIGKVSLKYK